MEIRLSDLHFRYRQSRSSEAIAGITAKIGPGIHLLLGENGAGKTTLLHLIDGLLTPTSGECRIDDTPASWRLPSILSRVSFACPGMELPATTINEMVKIHAQFYPSFSPETLASNLREFGMDGSEKLKRLSMGNRQKATVAYILSLKTPIVLLDEPATGLDIDSKQTLQQMIARCVDPEQTVIVSTHNFADLQHLYDGVIILNHGKLQLAASTDVILERVAFTITTELPENPLYSEQRLGRHHAIVMNPEGRICSDIDYKLLYSAIHNSQVNALLIELLNDENR